MNPVLQNTWKHMVDLGLGALAQANCHAAFIDFGHGRWSSPARWADLSVLQAAHAAEIFIKARISQEHPLLIFDQLPKSNKVLGNDLDLIDLFRTGRTIQWTDLPERLWATTGIKIPNLDKYDSFGKLRNGIQHFGPANDRNPDLETLEFIYSVIDPFINQCWGLYAIDYDENSEEYCHFINALVDREILFLVSPQSVSQLEYWDVDWAQVNEPYRTEMQLRIQNAKAIASD